MTHPYIENAHAWCFALRTLMGYPASAPPFHAIAWCSSGPPNLEQSGALTQLAADMRRDIVHVTFALDDHEPLGISLALRREHGIEWLTGIRPYASSEKAKVELLAHDRRWHVGPRQMLTSAKLPPNGKRVKGEQIARRRWRNAASNMAFLSLDGSVWVPAGGRYADAVPHKALKIAA